MKHLRLGWAVRVLGVGSLLVLAPACASEADDDSAIGQEAIVGQRLPAFDLMWSTYPHGSEDDVKELVGGAARGDWIANVCTIRISRVFNYSGFAVPRGPKNDEAGLHTITGGDGKPYAFRVREMRDYLRKTIGAPTIVRRNPAAGIDRAEFAGKRGVIAFDVPTFSDATGHFDLWNGSQAAHQDYFDRATMVELWEAPE